MRRGVGVSRAGSSARTRSLAHSTIAFRRRILRNERPHLARGVAALDRVELIGGPDVAPKQARAVEDKAPVPPWEWRAGRGSPGMRGTRSAAH